MLRKKRLNQSFSRTKSNGLFVNSGFMMIKLLNDSHYLHHNPHQKHVKTREKQQKRCKNQQNLWFCYKKDVHLIKKFGYRENYDGIITWKNNLICH